MRMLKILPTRDEHVPAAKALVTCYGCASVATWADAARQGWAVDLDGPPFKVYLCGECLDAQPGQVN